MKYKDYNDYELLSYISEQNEEANEIIYEKYKPLIIGMAKKMVTGNIGIEITDLIAEGFLGLSQAIDSYDGCIDIEFRLYARRCILNAMLSLIRKHRRLKNKYLSESISYDDVDSNILNTYNDSSINPDNIILKNEFINNIYKMAKEVLSYYEYQVFIYKGEGLSYSEIAKILDKSPKEIDNTLYRIRNKLKKYK